MTQLLYVWKKKASAAAKMEGRQALQRVDVCNFNAIRDNFSDWCDYFTTTSEICQQFC